MSRQPLYQLKKEAVPFFKKELATQIHMWDTWKSYNVDMNALDDVKPTYITYGHESETGTGSTLGGWSCGDNYYPEGARFNFCIHFPSMKSREFDEFSNGQFVRGLMDKIQLAADSYFLNFKDPSQDW